MESAEELPEGEWLCDECTRGAHACKTCGEFGCDGADIFKCSDAKRARPLLYCCNSRSSLLIHF